MPKKALTTPTEPVRLATVPFDTLQNQQWDLALLFMQALSRPLTIDEVRAQIDKLAAVIHEAEISWRS